MTLAFYRAQGIFKFLSVQQAAEPVMPQCVQRLQQETNSHKNPKYFWLATGSDEEKLAQIMFDYLFIHYAV